MNDINTIKEELIESIIKISEEIHKAKNVSGLIILDTKIQKMYENYILLKALETRNSKFQNLESFVINSEEKETKTQDIVVLNENQSEISKKININLNDRIAFINILFKGNKSEYENFINNLEINDLESSGLYIEKLKSELKLNEEDMEFIDRLTELNKNRFF